MIGDMAIRSVGGPFMAQTCPLMRKHVDACKPISVGPFVTQKQQFEFAPRKWLSVVGDGACRPAF
jgi:hypothetical protein